MPRERARKKVEKLRRNHTSAKLLFGWTGENEKKMVFESVR